MTLLSLQYGSVALRCRQAHRTGDQTEEIKFTSLMRQIQTQTSRCERLDELWNQIPLTCFIFTYICSINICRKLWTRFQRWRRIFLGVCHFFPSCHWHSCRSQYLRRFESTYFVNFIILAVGWKKEQEKWLWISTVFSFKSCLILGSKILTFKHLFYYLKIPFHIFYRNTLWVFTQITAIRFGLLYHLKAYFNKPQ